MQAHSLAISALREMEGLHRDKNQRQQQAARKYRGDHNFSARLDAVLATEAIIEQEQAARAQMHLKYGPEAVKIADAILRQNTGRF